MAIPNTVISLVVEAINNATAVLRDVKLDTDSLAKSVTTSMAGATGATSGFSAALGSLRGVLAGVGLTLGAGVAFSKFISEASEAEESAVRLDLAYKKFGETVGVTREELDDFANEVQSSTAFSDDATKQMQATLLRFTSVTGETFKRARQVVVDLAAEMGGDLSTAAFSIGRALEDPETAMRALRQAGVLLTDQQRDMIKVFSETGDKASAQSLILGLLESKTRGSAEALGNTLNGALQRLNNTFGDLFEGTEGGLTPLTQSINQLAIAIGNPALVTAFQVVATETTKWAAALVNVISLLPRLAVGLGELAGRLTSGPDTLDGILQERVNNAQYRVDEYSSGKAGTLAEIRASKKELEAAKIALQEYRIEVARAGATTGPINKLRANELQSRRPVLQKSLEQALDSGDLKWIEAARESLKELDTQIAKLRNPAVAGALTDAELEKRYQEARLKTEKALKEAAEATKKAKEEQDKWNATILSGQKAVDEFGNKVRAAVAPTTTGAEEFAQMQEEMFAVLDRVREKGDEARDQRNKNIEESLAAAREEAERLKDFMQSAANQIQQTFAGMFMNIGKGGLRGLVRDFARAFQQIFAQAAALDLAKALKLDRLFSGSGGGGGFVAGLFKGVGSLFGFAGGTNYSPGGLATVGEEGPERVFLPAGSRVMNSRQMAFAGGGVSFAPNTTIHITMSGEGGVEELRRELLTVIAYSNQKQANELDRKLYRNGIGRIR